MDWRHQAACRDTPDADTLFFPDSRDTRAADGAKAVCGRCPVRVDCAVAGADEPHGIWGGTGEDDRRRARRAHAGSGR